MVGYADDLEILKAKQKKKKTTPLTADEETGLS
jgi:hypothetical protein